MHYLYKKLPFKLFNQLGLVLPVLFLFASVISVFSGRNNINYNDLKIQIILATFFNNGLHNMITFYLLFCVEEYGQFLNEKNNELKKSVLLFFFKIFIIYTCLFFFIQNLSAGGDSFYAFYLVLISQTIVTLYAIHHEASQSFGLTTLQYHSQNQKNPLAANEYIVKKIVGYERLIVPVILFVSIINLYAQHSLPGLAAELILVFNLFCVLCYVAFFLRKIYKVDPHFFRSRCLFTARYLLMPLSSISAIAGFGRLVTHRFEYYQIAHLTKQNTKSHRLGRKNMILFSTALVLCVAVFGRRYYVMSTSYMQNKEIVLTPLDMFLNVLTTSLGFTHYYIDRVIFRFKDKTVQNNQGQIFRRSVLNA